MRIAHCDLTDLTYMPIAQACADCVDLARLCIQIAFGGGRQIGHVKNDRRDLDRIQAHRFEAEFGV